MGKVVNFPTPLDFENDQEFILDFARYSEGLLTQKFLRAKYKFSNEVWESLGGNERLLDLIEAAQVRRMRDGSAKRELSQKHVLKAPEVLKDILLDTGQSARHRIDSAKTLDSMAANGPEGAAAGALFQITINLGADRDGKEIVERYSKTIAINADPDDVTEHDSKPQSAGGATPAAASNALDDALEALMQY